MQSSRASFPDSPPRSGTILGVVKMAAGAVRLRIPTLSRLFSSAMPTTLSRLDVSELAPVVSSYSVQGFTIRGNKLIGSLALLPRGIFHWKVGSAADITPECFTLFSLVEPKLELVVLGTGAKICMVPPAVRQLLIRSGISLEVQDTPNACATFNFLLGEGRLAGAALIPPDTL